MCIRDRGYSVKKGQHAALVCNLWKYTDKPGKAAKEMCIRDSLHAVQMLGVVLCPIQPCVALLLGFLHSGLGIGACADGLLSLIHI